MSKTITPRLVLILLVATLSISCIENEFEGAQKADHQVQLRVDQAFEIEQKAIAAQERGDLKLAEQLLQESLSIVDDGAVRIRLARLYSSQGKEDEAYQTLNQIYGINSRLSVSSSDRTSKLEFAELCIKRGELHNANKVLHEIVDAEERSIGESFPDVRPVDESIENLLAASYALCALDQILKAQSEADFSEATRLLKESLRKWDDPKVRFYLGYSLSGENKEREAREEFDKVRKEARDESFIRLVDEQIARTNNKV